MRLPRYSQLFSGIYGKVSRARGVFEEIRLGIMIKIRIGMATPPTPIWFCCNCVQLLGFCRNSGAIPAQSGAIALAIGRDLPSAWDDTKLATLIVISRALSGSATGRQQ